MKLFNQLMLLTIAVIIIGCRQDVLIGSKRDAHGCIPSAGYVWDPARNKCLRPWESLQEANESELENQ
jgi:hypothetical protein